MDLQTYPPLFYVTVFAAVTTMGRITLLMMRRLNTPALVAAMQKLLTADDHDRAVKLCRAGDPAVVCRMLLPVLESVTDVQPDETEWDLAERARSAFKKSLAHEQARLWRGAWVPAGATVLAVLASMAMWVEHQPAPLHAATGVAVVLTLLGLQNTLHLVREARTAVEVLLPDIEAGAFRRSRRAD